MIFSLSICVRRQLLPALVMSGHMAVYSRKGTEGFLAGFQIAVFAFVGVELVGTTAAETKDPQKNLPKAINADSCTYYFVLCIGRYLL